MSQTNQVSEQLFRQCTCRQDARNMTLAVTALAIMLSEGKTTEEINIMANIFNGIGAQLDILAAYNCNSLPEGTITK